MIKIFQDKRIILGVSGSIAAYKAADLASKLTQAGAIVNGILTEAACKFITPLTFQSVTGKRAFTDQDLWSAEGHVLHIGLGKDADLMIIAPASANTIARLACGFADNLLCLTALAATCPLVLAPAMDGGMYAHPATQNNIKTLQERGVHFIGPIEGRMASGMIGLGRMAEPSEIMGELRYFLSRDGDLKGKKVVVTAGGTAEAIDAVRAITNRSSGKQGFAIAQAALDHGGDVLLIAANTQLPTPTGAMRINVTSAKEMHAAVMDAIQDAAALIMAAAVADFQPEITHSEKIKKENGIPQIQLTYTPDILADVSRYRQHSGYPRVIVGFAAESQDLVHNAQQKLEKKNLDLIVANDISASDAGFAVDTNRVILMDKLGKIEEQPLMSKEEVGELIIQRVVQFLGSV
ncbi:MAG: bifunctional phosphopantothenoylcysteine decarboxylase/phosphopantothenate--cysteine ligase CoaBC [Anaerolineales bacterium]